MCVLVLVRVAEMVASNLSFNNVDGNKLTFCQRRPLCICTSAALQRKYLTSKAVCVCVCRRGKRVCMCVCVSSESVLFSPSYPLAFLSLPLTPLSSCFCPVFLTSSRLDLQKPFQKQTKAKPLPHSSHTTTTGEIKLFAVFCCLFGVWRI